MLLATVGKTVKREEEKQMSRFYGSMANGKVTRCSRASEGLDAHIRGWDIGGKVFIDTDTKDNDVINFRLSSGAPTGNMTTSEC